LEQPKILWLVEKTKKQMNSDIVSKYKQPIEGSFNTRRRTDALQT